MDAAPQDLPEDAPRHGPAFAVLVATGLVLLFIVAQIFAFGIVALTGAEIATTLSSGEDAPMLAAKDALLLAAVQFAGILAVAGLVWGGASTVRRIGLRPGAGATRAGNIALLPVTLLVIVPSLVVALVTSDTVLAPDLDPAKVAAYVTLAVFIAVNEELWFRGLVVDHLGGALRPWLTIVASAVLFGLPHVGATRASWLNAVAVTLAVGVPFAAVRLRYDVLLPLIVCHAMIDVWAFLHEASVVPTGEPSTAEIAAGLVLPALIALAYAGWFMRTRASSRPVMGNEVA